MSDETSAPNEPVTQPLADIQVDEAIDDPGYESSDDLSTMTQSVRSSIYEHRFEYGRRYHAYKEGAYFMPNDEPEQDRMDMQHHTLQMVLKSLSFSPLEDPQRVLDLGCGTGLWCMEYAEENPQAEVYGVDLSPIQPTWVPPNVRFQVDDIEDTWTWPDDHFDLINSRLMLAGSVGNVERYFEQAFRHLKPGGFFELHDLQMILKSEIYPLDDETDPSPLPRWAKTMRDGIQALGKNLGPNLEANVDLMKRIGYVDIVYRPFKVPLGRWPKDRELKAAGIAQMVALSEGLPSLSVGIFAGVLGWRTEEVEVFMAQVRTDMKAKMKKGCYWPGAILYGRKPHPSERP